MNRRKALGGILAAGAVGIGVFSGYKWYNWHKTPDLAYLTRRRATIVALSETIIPATDTPGAIAAGVPDFIIMAIRDLSDAMTANKFIEGLKDLDHHCQHHFGKAYEACTASQQEATLALFEREGTPAAGIWGKVQDRYLGRSFFALLKEYAVKGYCTSEPGMTRALAYVPVPGSFHGCIPLGAGQPAWATR